MYLKRYININSNIQDTCISISFSFAILNSCVGHYIWIYPRVTSDGRRSLARISLLAILVMFHFGSKESRAVESKYCSMHSSAETGCILARVAPSSPFLRESAAATYLPLGTKAKLRARLCISGRIYYFAA